MKVENTLEKKIANLKRFVLEPDSSTQIYEHRTGFCIRYSPSKEAWFAGFGTKTSSEYVFEGSTPDRAMDNFLKNFTFID